MVGIPKPRINFDLEEEELIDEDYQEVEETPEEIGKERLIQSFSKILGFIAAIGLPKEVFYQKVQEYSDLADKTGVTEALITTIEYYFPDVELSPAIMLLITGVAFVSAVLADRASVLEKYKAKKREEGKKKPKEEVKKK